MKTNNLNSNNKNDISSKTELDESKEKKYLKILLLKTILQINSIL